MSMIQLLNQIKTITEYLDNEGVAYMVDLNMKQYDYMMKISGLKLSDLMEVLKYLFR